MVDLPESALKLAKRVLTFGNGTHLVAITIVKDEQGKSQIRLLAHLGSGSTEVLQKPRRLAEAINIPNN